MMLFSSSRASVARHLLIPLCPKLQVKATGGVRANEIRDKEGRGRRKEWEKERRKERLQKACSEMF